MLLALTACRITDKTCKSATTPSKIHLYRIFKNKKLSLRICILPIVEYFHLRLNKSIHTLL